MAEPEYVGQNTAILRTGQEGFHVRLRELLRQRGLDPGACALLGCWSEDTNIAAGEVAFLDRGHALNLTVASFEYDFGTDDFVRWDEGPWGSAPSDPNEELRRFVLGLLRKQ